MDDIAVRIARFKKLAPKVCNQYHLDRIMETFPENRRAEILETVTPLLGFTPEEDET